MNQDGELIAEFERHAETTLDQRHQRGRVFFYAAVLLAPVVIGLSVPIPFESRAAGAIGDLMHAPLFGALMLGSWWAMQRLGYVGVTGQSRVVRRLLVGFGLLAFGIVMELFQELIGRTGAVHDAVANGLGILAAIAWLSWRDCQRLSFRSLLLAGVAAVLLATAWWTPARTLTDVWVAYRSFPMLASFETSTELTRWYLEDCQVRLSERDATEGAYSMELLTRPLPYSGVTLTEVPPDWTTAKALELDALLDEQYAGSNVQFLVKVVDSDHVNYHSDTFRRVFALEPGVQRHLKILLKDIVDGPASRQLDLSKIRFLSLLVLESESPATLRVDSIRLTN